MNTILADAQLVLDSSSAAQLAQYREWGVIIAAMVFITAVLFLFLKRESNHDSEMNDCFDRLTDALQRNTDAQNEFRRVVEEKFDAIDERVLKIERNACEMNHEIQNHSERLDQHEETLADYGNNIKKLEAEKNRGESSRVPLWTKNSLPEEKSKTKKSK